MSERPAGRDPERETPERRPPGVPPHQPDPDDRDVVDEASEESFPASDPPPPGGPRVG